MVKRHDRPVQADGILNVLGANVLQFRSDREWTADDLASRVNLDRAAIINIEAGLMKNVDIDHLDELATAFGIEAAELVKPRRVR